MKVTALLNRTEEVEITLDASLIGRPAAKLQEVVSTVLESKEVEVLGVELNDREKERIAPRIPNTEDFFQYLESLNLFRITLKDKGYYFEALVSWSSEVEPSSFSQVLKTKEGHIVRLSKKDLFNDRITNGFFTRSLFK